MASIAQSMPEWDPSKPLWHRSPAHPELAGIVARIVGYRENGRGLVGDVEMAPLTMPLVISFGDLQPQASG